MLNYNNDGKCVNLYEYSRFVKELKRHCCCNVLVQQKNYTQLNSGRI